MAAVPRIVTIQLGVGAGELVEFDPLAVHSKAGVDHCAAAAASFLFRHDGRHGGWLLAAGC